MKIAKMVALIAASAFTFQAGAAVRPAAANLSLTPQPVMAGARVGAPLHGSRQKLASGGIIVAVLAAGVVAGGVILATKNDNNGHSSSP